MKFISLVTGGFDPIHPGHIDYFREAKKLTGYLIVGVNSDEWLIQKKGRAFMSYTQRCEVVRAIRYVDEVIKFNDTDGSARDAILQVLNKYPDSNVCFCNGGDRKDTNTPETDIKDKRVEFIYDVGGDKRYSSSEIQGIVRKPWGYYDVLGQGDGWKVKRLVVNDGHRTSLQFHKFRDEYHIKLPGKDVTHIPAYTLHRVEPGEYIEVQVGTCDEWDIVREEDDYGR